LLWALLLAFPLPYIATTAGWMTAELGRQPWVVYGLLRTSAAASPSVHTGTVVFTLIGFCGLYLLLGLFFLFLIGREIPHRPHGPEERPGSGSGTPSSRCCSPPTSCSTASTSARARCIGGSRGTTASAGRCSARSARSGTGTRSACSHPAARSSSRSRPRWRRGS